MLYPASKVDETGLHDCFPPYCPGCLVSTYIEKRDPQNTATLPAFLGVSPGQQDFQKSSHRSPWHSNQLDSEQSAVVGVVNDLIRSVLSAAARIF